MWTVREVRGDFDRTNVKDVKHDTKRDALNAISRMPNVATIVRFRVPKMYVVRISK